MPSGRFANYVETPDVGLQESFVLSSGERVTVHLAQGELACLFEHEGFADKWEQDEYMHLVLPLAVLREVVAKLDSLLSQEAKQAVPVESL